MNCRRGLHFANCNLNSSVIAATEFACTAYLKDPSYKLYIENILNPNGIVQRLGTSTFVSANAASGMQFSATNWSNTAFLPPELRGIGILSINSRFTVNNACSMDGLDIGIRADATDPLKYIYVSGSNQFLGNRTGIQLRGGSLHKIIAENEFIAKYDPASPVQIQATPGIGIFNAASTQILIEENSFSAGGVNVNNAGTYGIVSENTGSASSLYKKNLFTNVQIGNQTQKNNGGLNLWCNEHTQNTKAWYINPLTPGEFRNQGFCILSNALTSENEFKDPACQNALNHIHSSVDFDYWVKTTELDPPNCNSNWVGILPCSDPESGCDQSIFLNPGNVGDYFTSVSNMQEGTERELLVNELLRYYIELDEIDTVLLLLANETAENYLMTHALTLLSIGEINEAQDVVENLPLNSPETESFVDYFNILVYAKSNEIELSNLPDGKVEDLKVIAENRTLAAYAAQIILENYYNLEYPSILETDSTIQYRSKQHTDNKSTVAKNILLINPNPVKELLNMDYSFSNLGPYYFNILNLDGKNVYQTSKIESNGSMVIDLGLIPMGVYFIHVGNLDKTIVSKRFIKN